MFTTSPVEEVVLITSVNDVEPLRNGNAIVTQMAVLITASYPPVTAVAPGYCSGSDMNNAMLACTRSEQHMGCTVGW